MSYNWNHNILYIIRNFWASPSKRSGLVFLFLIAFTSNGFAQEQQYFENPIILNEQKGLDVGKVACVIEDKTGFLWIGGNKGLQRFDGLHFKKYTSKSGDSLSLISNSIRHLHYDETHHQLWISTWETGRGLSVLDLKTETFKNYYYTPTKPGGITGASMFWSYQDKFDNYWASTKGLARYILAADSFRHVAHPVLPDDPYLISSRRNTILSYAQDQVNDSILWLGSQGGLQQFNVLSEKFLVYPIFPFEKTKTTVRSVFHHSDDFLYIGTWDSGLFRFDKKTKLFEKCLFAGHSKIKGATINRIISIRAKSQSTLWVTTEAGLVEYDTNLEKIIEVKSNNLDKDKIYGAQYQDKNGRLFTWVTNKIFIYDPLRQQIKPYNYYPKSDKFNFIPRRLLVDENMDKIWVAPQISEGLYRVDLKTNSWEIFPPPKDYFNTLNTFQAWDILKTKDGKLLVVDVFNIYQFSKQENKLVLWENSPKTNEAGFRRIIEGKDGSIWVGSESGGLFRIDPSNNFIRQYTNEMIDDDKQGTGQITDLQEDRNGNIWIRSNGYSVYDIKKDTFYNFAYFYPDQKIVHHIQALGIDAMGNVWISSTNQTGGAIGITDADFPEKGVIHYVDKQNGLKHDQVDEFFLDGDKNNWLISNHLEKINPVTQDTTFYHSNFLNNKEIYNAIQLSNGKIAIGYRKGIGIFHPDSLQLPDDKVYPYVHSFSVFDQVLKIESSPLKKVEVFLNPNQNFFSLELSALNPAYFGQVEFLYKLEGVDPEWVMPKDRNYVSYTDVGGGDYVFQLKAKRENGNWNESPYELHIHIATPWYRTNTAILFWSILFFSAIYYLYKFQLSKKLAHEETNRLKELDSFKTRFYSNITHEFRTPLTVISGMADELKNNLDKEPEKKINLIKKNSLSLLALVNQMLDLSKLRARKMSSNIQQNDIISFLKYLTESHQSFAKLKNVGIQFYSEEDKLLMDFDADQMEQILNNLVSNAVKFTKKYGNILVVAKKDLTHEKAFLEIKVKDDGIGISKEQLPYIFDRFHQANPIHKTQGSGIGLALVKELTTAMNGKIQVISDLNKGSTFSLRFPISNKAPLAKSRLIDKTKTSLATPANSEKDIDLLNADGPILLIIEDNPDVMYYLSTSLGEHYQIITAQNGKTGIEKAMATLPDIIISDVMMPEMDGFEVCEKLKKEETTNHIPIILLTAKATSEDKLHGLSHGADAYLVKPFEKEELMVRLDNLLAVRKTLQKKYSSSLISGQTSKSSQLTKEAIFVKKIEEIILANLDNENFSVHELSRGLLLSRSQAHRKIKALTGMSTSIYIRHVRLQKAKELILNTDLPISEVAYQVGFKTLAYFSQVYKDTFGKSPSATRI